MNNSSDFPVNKVNNFPLVAMVAHGTDWLVLSTSFDNGALVMNRCIIPVL